MSNLAPHQQRVVDEKFDLDERRHKLHTFMLGNPVFKALDEDEQDRMKRQYNAMTLYSDVLGERIAAF